MEVDLDQTATYWRPSANDGVGGVTWAQGLEIPVAYADKIEVIRTDEGKKFKSSRIYYTETDLLLGDYITIGKHEGAANPVDAKEVMLLTSNPAMTTLKKAVV